MVPSNGALTRTLQLSDALSWPSKSILDNGPRRDNLFDDLFTSTEGLRSMVSLVGGSGKTGDEGPEIE